MFSMLESAVKSSAAASATGSRSVGMKQAMAPVFLGGSIAAGIVSVVIGGYKIIDCVRYQTGPGQCDKTIEVNLTNVIVGGAVLTGGWGGFNTYNPQLHSDEKPAPIAERGFVVDDESLATPPAVFSTSEAVANMTAEGLTQTEIAQQLGISRYKVRKMIQSAMDSHRGR